MKATIATVAVAAVLTGCAGRADTTATQTVAATPTTSEAQSAARPGHVPDGWGEVRPDEQAIKAMAAWAERSRVTAIYAAMTDGRSELDAVRTAVNARDVSAAKLACRAASEHLTDELSTHIPTPEPDLTHALQSLVTDAETFAAECNALTDPAQSSDLQTLWKALLTVLNDMTTAGSIMKRDQRILEGANR